MNKLQTNETGRRRSLQWWHLPLLLLLILGTIYIARTSSPSNHWQKNQGSVFGTLYHITYNSPTDLQAGIDQTLSQVDQSLSPFNPNSVITAINHGSSRKADTRLATVIALAQQISTDTDGAFDITVAPLVNAWGFGFQASTSVTTDTIDSLRQFVGYQKLQISHNGDVTKQDPRLMLDCSAIAKGYGVDAVGLYLESQSVTNYMVEIGGEVRVRGTNPDGKTWHIGINQPTEDTLATNTQLQDILSVTNIAMATSGNYRNYYVREGRKYAHTIDPRTGYPVSHNLLSATVLATDCATADAYATAYMVMGLEKAQQHLNTHPHLQAYLIYTDTLGNIVTWNNLKVKN